MSQMPDKRGRYRAASSCQIDVEYEVLVNGTFLQLLCAVESNMAGFGRNGLDGAYLPHRDASCRTNAPDRRGTEVNEHSHAERPLI
jgi:hypothetical protein